MHRAQDLRRSRRQDRAAEGRRLGAAGQPLCRPAGARPEIFTWGIAIRRGSPCIPRPAGLGVEHGPRGGDELNLLKAGANYGWPLATHGIDYNGSRIGAGISAKPGMEQPVRQWTPSIAPSGLSFYNGNLFPAWRGHIFHGRPEVSDDRAHAAGRGATGSPARGTHAGRERRAARFGRSALDRTAGSTCSPTGRWRYLDHRAGLTGLPASPGPVSSASFPDRHLARTSCRTVKPCPTSARMAAGTTLLRHYAVKLLPRRGRVAPDAGQGC